MKNSHFMTGCLEITFTQKGTALLHTEETLDSTFIDIHH